MTEHEAWRRLWRGPRDVPSAPLDEETRRSQSLPRTIAPARDGLRQPLIFEPALKQFHNAYRAGEPRFADDESATAWWRARRTALDTVLTAVADGPYAPHLVLRGGVLMTQWFGSQAREPGDIDLVVTPAEWAADGPETARLLREIADAAAAASGPAAIDAAGAVVEEIWTYDRVPGRRMLLPWTAPGTPGGTVQIDVVFNEPLPEPPTWTDLRPLGQGPGCRLQTVSPGLSLAWKLMWLLTDRHPMGKDLYDAVLLAEREPPNHPLIRDAFLTQPEADTLRPPGRWWLHALGPVEMEVEWEHFAAEYPRLAGDGFDPGPRHDLTSRLATALEAFLATAEPPGEAAHRRWARWLAGPVAEARAAAGPVEAALGHWAAHGPCGAAAAVVILRELAGPERLGPEDALRAVVAGDEDAWTFLRVRPERWAPVLAMVADDDGPAGGAGRGYGG
ncbi:nucleotidyl transferase AbiEii/AbiGii toxin family protein [Streptomyces hainanensis]|uniref:nucleotidyl transferase AbiEii/AbiGii toxin family protein n=1 Tax=Streptomyces hainanensis TaxID=402648 RepID=UPI001FB6E777|nr:nucleotidyl transferase AbiEii/AbiGii toxin family protein [Streptomyces hainanensis]